MGDREIEYYKKMAWQCEREAEALPNIEIKRQFQELAQQWRDLAGHAARHEGERSRKPSG
jgi:hypothetical protein